MENYQLELWQTGLSSDDYYTEPLSETTKEPTHVLLQVKAVCELLRDFEPDLLKHSDESMMTLDMIHEYLLGRYGKSLSKIIEDSVSADFMIALDGMKAIVKKYCMKDLKLLDKYLDKKRKQSETMMRNALKAQLSPKQPIIIERIKQVKQLSFTKFNQTYYERSKNSITDADRSQWETEKNPATLVRQADTNNRRR